MLYSFSKLNNKVTDYLIDKITFMKDSSFHNMTMQIRKDCILSIDYGLPNIINDGFRKAIEQKNDKAIDVFLGAGADPEIARGIVIDTAIKNNDFERLKLITQHHKFDLSEYTQIPGGIEDVFGPQSICKNIVYEAQQEYLNSAFSSVHKMEKEQLQDLIDEEIDSLDYHKIYQNLTTFFTSMRRFTYEEYKQTFSDASKYALENKNDYAVTALAVLQQEQKNPEMGEFIKYAISTKNMYLLDLVIGDSRVDLTSLVPVPKFLFKEDDNLFDRSLKISSDSTLGPINKLFKEEFRDLNFNNSVFAQHQKYNLTSRLDATPLYAPALSKDDIAQVTFVNSSSKVTYAQRVAEMIQKEDMEWITNESSKPVESTNLSSVAPIISKEDTTKFIQQRRIDSIVLPPAPVIEKTTYKAEPKIPYKHILNNNKEIVSMEEIQKKWDIALIAETFNVTGDKKTMRDFTFKFAEENHTSWHNLSHVGYGLKRIPLKGLTSHFQCDSTKFIENYIPKLHKILKDKTKDEVFEKIDKYLKFLDHAVIGIQRLKEVYEPTPRRKKTI